ALDPPAADAGRPEECVAVVADQLVRDLDVLQLGNEHLVELDRLLAAAERRREDRRMEHHVGRQALGERGDVMRAPNRPEGMLAHAQPTRVRASDSTAASASATCAT